MGSEAGQFHLPGHGDAGAQQCAPVMFKAGDMISSKRGKRLIYGEDHANKGYDTWECLKLGGMLHMLLQF